MEVNKILGKLKPFQNKTVLVSQYQNSADIIQEIIKAHSKYSNEYDKISKYFWKGTPKKTAEYLFKYLKKNVNYDIEPDTKQTVKSPSAIIAQGYGDCKHYSLFAAGILDSLRRSGKPINWAYRFANYKLFSRTPHHVFVVINPDTTKEVWIDPVLEFFDNKKPYVNAQDKNYKQMALYSISGIGKYGYKQYQKNRIAKAIKFFEKKGFNMPESKYYTKYLLLNKRYNMLKQSDTVSGGFNRDLNLQSVAGVSCCGGFTPTTATEGIGRRTKAERKKARRYGPNCKGRTGPKIALTLARRAYLLLLRLNFRKLGVKTYIALQNPKTADKMYEKWCKVGGRASLLRSTATKAYLKAKRKGKVSGEIDTTGMIGVPSVAILWAQAQPIIAALAPIITLAMKFVPKGSKAEEILTTATEVTTTYEE